MCLPYKYYSLMASSSNDRFRITGGARLVGEVTVTGAKNSVLNYSPASVAP